MAELDELKEKIYYSKTREYFKEIEKSFYNENYRSAIVMLYSVVIADLLYKLEELRDYYNDSVANNILEDINNMRNSNPKSSEWETILVKRIFDKTKILEAYVYTNIDYLKNMRNYSAHPVLNQNNELISPSREKTLGLIIDMLKGILVRPPLYIKKITNTILMDISDKKEYFLVDKENFEQYVIKKYIDKMPLSMIIGLFRDFWKITFKLENEECSENRRINFEFLLILIRKFKIQLLDNMRNENSHYCNLSENAENMKVLIEFLYYEPDVYNLLNSESKIMIGTFLNKDKGYKTIAYYISDNIINHIESLVKENLAYERLNKLLENKAKIENEYNVLMLKYIEIFSTSLSFNEADRFFDIYIRNNIAMINQEMMLKILEAINNNSQIHNRWKSIEDNNYLIEYSELVDWGRIRLDDYPNFKYRRDVLFSRVLPF